MPGKTARSARRQPLELPKVTAAVLATRLSCSNAGKAPKFALVRGSSGESPAISCARWRRPSREIIGER